MGSKANIYSLYNLTFNLAINIAIVGLCWTYIKLNLFYTCNTVGNTCNTTHVAVLPVCLLY